MNKTAKEMFEELGYGYHFDEFYNKISYRKYLGFIGLNVDFYLKDKDYVAYKDTVHMVVTHNVGIKLHQAITQQMKELGWIE